jgi:hypothetical protein
MARVKRSGIWPLWVRWIAGPEEGAVHVQVRYKDGPPYLVYGQILLEGAGPPGVRGIVMMR